MRIMSPSRARMTRKVAGSAAALGVAAAVAGLGTYSTFTDSTTPMTTKVDAGVLSLSLTDKGSTATVPFQGSSLMAGDSISQPLDLVNDGTTPLASVTMRMWATSSSILDTDAVRGLQLKVQSCSVAWSASNTCAGTARTFYDGRIVVTQPLAAPASLTPGGVDHLLLTASLPASANGNAYQGVSSSLSLVFDGVQRAGAGR